MTENLDKLKTQNSELLHNLKVQETKVKDTIKENNITQAKIQVVEGKLGYVDKVTKKAEELVKTVFQELFFIFLKIKLVDRAKGRFAPS